MSVNNTLLLTPHTAWLVKSARTTSYVPTQENTQNMKKHDHPIVI